MIGHQLKSPSSQRTSQHDGATPNAGPWRSGRFQQPTSPRLHQHPSEQVELRGGGARDGRGDGDGGGRRGRGHDDDGGGACLRPP